MNREAGGFVNSAVISLRVKFVPKGVVSTVRLLFDAFITSPGTLTHLHIISKKKNHVGW